MSSGTDQSTVAETHPQERRLRILVCPHELVPGGSQTNAIDIAGELQERGHIVEILAPVGPLVEKVRDRGLPFVAAAPRRHPLGAWRTSTMREAIRRFKPDIVHTFEAPPSMASVFALITQPHRTVMSVMSMEVPDFLPKDVPLIVGTRAIALAEMARSGPVHLLEPPVDTRRDQPLDRLTARRRLGVAKDRFVVSVVGRLSAEHGKARGVRQALYALATRPDRRSITVLVAGAGDEQSVVQHAAAKIENLLDIRMLGNVADPRDIYAAADVVFGMGSSALRAMAHAKPVIVQGDDGFWCIVSPISIDRFFADGYFGHGGDGEAEFLRCFDEIVSLGADGQASLGAFGRRIVTEHYSLSRIVDATEKVYFEELSRPQTWTSESLRSAQRYVTFRLAVAAPWLVQARRVLKRRRASVATV